MGRDEELSENIRDLLNSAMKCDPVAIHALIVNRVPCNQALVEHPCVVVDDLGAPDRSVVGLLGILNGLLPESHRVAYQIDESGLLVGFEVIDVRRNQ